MTWLEGYQQVEDRLREFLSNFPEARVLTELVSVDAKDPGDVILFRAVLYRDSSLGREIDATGYAHQRILAEPPKIVNKKTGEVKVVDSAPEWTSPWEVAETSAIGRALANLGYAPKGKRPSREEISKASVAAQGRGRVESPETAGPPEREAATDSKSAAAQRESGGEKPSEEAAAPEPEEASSLAAKPSGSGSSYAVDPATCTHRYPSGNYLPWDGDDRCPKCGTPKVAAIEGTTADLGGGT